MMAGLKRYGLTILSFAAILWLTLAPDPLPDNDTQMWEGFDKCVHLLMMGEVCCVWLWDRFRNRRFKVSTALLIALVVILFAGLVEIIQGAMGLGRSADIADLEAGALGVVAATTAWILGRQSQPTQS